MSDRLLEAIIERLGMVCEHLRPLEKSLIDSGVKETYRGQAWSRNCREWVYFRCVLDRVALRNRFAFAECVKDHEHRGTHDGQEAGFVCSQCHDGVMGGHPSESSLPAFR